MSTSGPLATILAVDDEPANLGFLEQVLRRDGHDRIHLLCDPRAALAAFDRYRPDIVLLDLNMPEVDGIALMQQIRERTSDPRAFVPIVILTADPSRESRRRALTAGATDFLVKPLDPLEVRLRVRNLLHTRRLHVDLQREKDVLEERVAQRTRQLEAANEALLAADRVKNDFVAMASHEMRTPLTILRGFTEVLLRRNDQVASEQRLQHLEVMLRNATRLERLVDDLLLAARIEAGETDAVEPFHVRVRSIDIGELIDDAIASSGATATDVVIADCPTEAVEADPFIVERIISNLLSNAAKYGAPPIEVRCSIGATTFEIVVRDHGEGIPEDFIHRIFERFTQASVGDRRTAKGTGLGLWIARRLAQLHGGDLTYEPASPGACFRASLRQLGDAPGERGDG